MEELAERMDKLERKIDMIIAMLQMKDKKVDEQEYLEFVSNVTEKRVIPYPIMDDEEILGT